MYFNFLASSFESEVYSCYVWIPNGLIESAGTVFSDFMQLVCCDMCFGALLASANSNCVNIVALAHVGLKSQVLI